MFPETANNRAAFSPLGLSKGWELLPESGESCIHERGLPTEAFSFFFKFIYFWLRWVFVAARRLWRAGATLRCGARASHCGGFSCCAAPALGSRAQ